MRLMVLSPGLALTRTRRRAAVFTEAATTRSPGPRATGTLSPVTSLSSTADCPSSTTPSQGMRSPGRTWTTSPAARRSARISSTDSHLADREQQDDDGRLFGGVVAFGTGGAGHQIGERPDPGARPAGRHALQRRGVHVSGFLARGVRHAR